MTWEMLKQGAMAGGQSVSIGAPCQPQDGCLFRQCTGLPSQSMWRAPSTSHYAAIYEAGKHRRRFGAITTWSACSMTHFIDPCSRHANDHPFRWHGGNTPIAPSSTLRQGAGVPTALICGGTPCALSSRGLSPTSCRSKLTWARTAGRQAQLLGHRGRRQLRQGGRLTCAPTSSPSSVTARIM